LIISQLPTCHAQPKPKKKKADPKEKKEKKEKVVKEVKKKKDKNAPKVRVEINPIANDHITLHPF
jgi:hypothetical protein